ncbi:MAG: hypothetical protein QOI10_614 [Solirubrobacterales bacterium]|nr:hypothetical protein [Solirubrobacterales bacterium]
MAAVGVALVAALSSSSASALELHATPAPDTAPDGCEPGSCTLREAILAANANPGEDRVLVEPGHTYALSLPGGAEDASATGDLDVTGPLELVATGSGRARIDAAQIDRVLDLFAAVKLEGLELTGGLAPQAGGAQGAAIRVNAGRLTLRDSAIVANAGPESAVELIGDDGMTARDSEVSDNVGGGIIDRGGGGLRAAHTEILRNSGTGVQGFGPGSLSLYHAVISDNALRGIQEFDGGDVAAVDAIIAGNGDQAIDEQGDGGLFVRRSRLRDNGSAAVTEDGDGELSVYRSKVTGSLGGAAVERGPGGISFIKARIAFNDGIGLSESDAGSVGLEETTLEGSPLGGVVERGEGGIGLTLAKVIDSGGVGLAEFDDGDVALVRAQVSKAEGAAITFDGVGSLLRSRLVDNGGGVAIANGSLSLGRSTIVANSGEIGGIAALNAGVALRQSTVGRNFSDGDGGGIALEGTSSLEATNSTVAENLALGSGGGVFIAAGGRARLNAVTIAANEADGGPGGGISLAPGATAIVDNSLIARNRSAAESPDCFGPGLASGGGNLIGIAAGCGELGSGGDLVRRDPRIGRLQPNGGPTSTVALRRGSPAIGAARVDAPRRDQRSRTRRDPDAGAYELG